MRAGNFGLLAATVIVLAGLPANAQITMGNSTGIGSPFHGVPPSVTSFNFGGQPGFHGVPASVTSLGFGNPGFQLNQPFGVNRSFGAHRPFGFHHRRSFGFFSSPFFGDIVAVPYAYPVYVTDTGVDDTMEEEDYRGGPTIFDRRGRGYYSVPRGEEDYRHSPDSERTEERATEERSNDQPRREQPVQAQPPTVLVFKDGHKSEILNYAIVGENLYELNDGRSKKIALAELDVSATQKENDERGVDFRVPAAKAN